MYIAIETFCMGYVRSQPISLLFESQAVLLDYLRLTGHAQEIQIEDEQTATFWVLQPDGKRLYFIVTLYPVEKYVMRNPIEPDVLKVVIS